MKIALIFALRELCAGVAGFRVLIACLALGVAAIAAVGSLSASLDAGLGEQGQSLLGGDISLRLIHRPASEAERAHLQAAGKMSVMADMRAMARRPEDRRRKLVQVNGIDSLYPLYGTLVTQPPHAATPDVLTRAADGWGVLVAPALARQLSLTPGDPLKIGDLVYRVRGTIETAPDQLGLSFSLGPRVLVDLDSLPETGLIQPGSLVRYHHRIAVPEGADVAGWITDTGAKFPEAGWRIRTRAEAAPGVTRAVERVALFLTLTGLTALAVGGVGVANAVREYLDGKTETIAMLKTLGAPAALIFRTYLLQILAFAGLGIGIGLLIGAMTPWLVDIVVGDRLPVPAVLAVYPGPLAVAALYGVLVTVVFALLPLMRARDIRPVGLFRAIAGGARWRFRWSDLVLLAAMAILLAGAAIWFTSDRMFAAWFVGGMAIAFLFLRLTGTLVAMLARWPGRGRISADLRLALANLYRPGAVTGSVVLSLGLGLTLLITVMQIDANIVSTVREQLPKEAPAFYFIDVQGNQAAEFDQVANAVPGVTEVVRVPMLRGRLTHIDGVPADKATVAPHSQWMLNGDRGLTYADAPPENSTLVVGDWWPANYDGPPLVSFDVEGARDMGLTIGDTLTVNVLGRPITAEIANLREIHWSTLGINFLMVFTPNTLVAAPQMHLATVEVASPEAEDALEIAVTDAFANVSAIRVRDAVNLIAETLQNLATAVRAISMVTLVSGILVLAGALAAGQRARAYDATILKVMGAGRRRILTIHLFEYAALGLATALVAAILGGLAAWAVITLVMEQDFALYGGRLAATIAITIGVTVTAGLLVTSRTLALRAATVLRG